MAALFEIQNFGPGNSKGIFVLQANVEVGATSLTFKDTTGLNANDILILGAVDDPDSERTTITSITNATTIVVPAFTQSHNKFDEANAVFGNTVKIYRAVNVTGNLPDDTSFSNIDSLTIDPDGTTTTYQDNAGGQGYWYKFTYTNGIAETLLSESDAKRGGGYGQYATIDEIRGEAGFKNNKNISDVLIDSRRIDAEQEINSELYNVYTLPFAGPAPSLVQQAARLIAAGLLLMTEYGPMASGNKHQGEDKLTKGRDLLERIKSRELILQDASGASLLLQPMVTSYPNAATDQTGTGQSVDTVAANDQDYGPAFRKAMRF